LLAENLLQRETAAEYKVGQTAMKFFFSGEIDALVGDHWRRVAYPMEKRLNEALGERDYGSVLQKIGLIPIILRPELRDSFRERRLFQRKEAAADYRTRIEFDDYMKADDSKRERLVARNLLDAIRDLARKAGKAFRADDLCDDVLRTLNLTPDDVAPARGAAQQGVAAAGASRRR
jgi:hypothetical protein